MKQKIVRIVLFALLFVFAAAMGWAEDMPRFNADVAEFFRSESQYRVSAMSKGQGGSLWLTGLGSFDYVQGFEGQATYLFGLNSYFSIPVFGAFCSIKESYNTRMLKNSEVIVPERATYTDLPAFSSERQETLFGAGILFQSSLGTIELDAGWDTREITYSGRIKGRTTTSSLSGSKTRLLIDNAEVKVPETNLYFSFLPVINTSEFPLIGLLVRTIQGQLGATKDDFAGSFWAKLITRRFDIGGLSIHLEPFYRRENIGAYLKADSYGGSVVVWFNNNELSLEGGYRDFYFKDRGFEDALDSLDTPYARLQLFTDENRQEGVSLFFDRTFFPFPMLGFVFKTYDIRCYIEGALFSDTDGVIQGMIQGGLMFRF